MFSVCVECRSLQTFILLHNPVLYNDQLIILKPLFVKVTEYLWPSDCNKQLKIPLRLEEIVIFHYFLTPYGQKI